MHRREALQRVAVILGGTVIGSELFLTGCKTEEKKASMTFSEEDVQYLDEIAETILPTTNTPGAKAAGVGKFMTVYVADCYNEDNQKIFHEGMGKVNQASEKKFDAGFMKLTPQQRHQVLVEVDQEAREYQKKKGEHDKQENEKAEKDKNYKKKDMPVHYFRLLRELTVLGYFTSEIGAKQALRYIETPGRYEGCIPYTKGEKAWA
jgi:hypothetical protein